MQIHFLIAQRHVNYPGEHAMEVLSVMTEHDKEENEAYMPQVEAEMRASGDFSHLAWVSIEVDEAEIDTRLNADAALDAGPEPRQTDLYAIRVLLARRQGRYPGQYGPEALCAMDEYSLSDNPEYLPEQAQKAVESQDFAALGYVDMGLDVFSLRSALFPEETPLPATLL